MIRDVGMEVFHSKHDRYSLLLTIILEMVTLTSYESLRAKSN